MTLIFIYFIEEVILKTLDYYSSFDHLLTRNKLLIRGSELRYRDKSTSIY